MEDTFELLYREANRLSGKKELSEVFKYKHVGCALITKDGNIYSGISVKGPSAIGFCAEQAACAEMLKNDEHIIKKILSVRNGVIIPPCGKCREFLRQLSEENMDTEVMVDDNQVVLLRELIPYAWDYQKGR